MKIIAVMPAYNEELMIADVVNCTKQYVDDIVVVDDGSKDKTSQIIQNLGIRYILHDKNYGAGKATNHGINAAKYHQADIVVTLDSDGQHDPDGIPNILQPIIDGRADITVGSRVIMPFKPWQLRQLKESQMVSTPTYRQFGVRAITWLYNLGSRNKLNDTQCCFRAFNKRVLNLITIEEHGFGLTIEPLIKARKLSLRIVEVPVTCIYHSDRKMNSSMHPVKQGLYTILRTIYLRIKYDC